MDKRKTMQTIKFNSDFTRAKEELVSLFGSKTDNQSSKEQ